MDGTPSMPSSPARDTRLTVDDFMLFPDDGKRHEIDPELDLVKVHRREDDGTFPRVAELTREADDALTSPLLPGWSLALGRLLADD